MSQSADPNSLPGELTDRGRETTLALGQRLRTLYVNQLGFLSKDLAQEDEYYLRYEGVPQFRNEI